MLLVLSLVCIITFQMQTYKKYLRYMFLFILF